MAQLYLHCAFILVLCTVAHSSALSIFLVNNFFGRSVFGVSENETLEVPTSTQKPPEPSLSYRREFIRDMAKESWNSYYRNAWGQELVRPVTLSKLEGHLATSGGTIIAALSTLWVMNLTEEFAKGQQWIEQKLDYSGYDKEGLPMHAIVNHHIGSLLSCYALTGDIFFLNKAVQLDKQIRPNEKNFATVWGRAKVNRKTKPTQVLAEWASQVLEYQYLTDLTGDRKYVKRIRKIEKFLDKLASFGTDLNVMGEANEGNHLMAKVKSYLQTNGNDFPSLNQFKIIIQKAESEFRFKFFPSLNLTYVHQYPSRSKHKHYRDCSLGAMFALASQAFLQENPVETIFAEHLLELAENITETCHRVSQLTPTRLLPFYFYVKNHHELVFPQFSALQRGYSLDPQQAESYFILYQITKQEKYRQYAWDLAQAIYKHCRVEGNGYTAIYNVNEVPVKMRDFQKPVFLGATLKYLYLTFSDDSLDLDKWFFNAVGQPLPVYGKNEAYLD